MLDFPIRLSTKVILPVGLATITIYAIRSVSDIPVAIVVGLALVVCILTVVGDWLSYKSSEAGLTLRIAREHGYKGPYLRFPKKWKAPQDLLPGELTCIRFTAVVQDPTGAYRFFLNGCNHSTSAAAHYFVWRDHGDYCALTIREPQTIGQIGQAKGATAPIRLLPFKIDMRCPHFLQPSYSDT